MTSSVAEQILARVAEVLGSAQAISAAVDRARQAPYDEDDHPAINIKRVNDEISPHANNLVRHRFTFDLHLHVAGPDYETQADALHVAVNAELGKDPDLSAYGNSLYCTGSESQSGEADFIAGQLTAHYLIQFLTRPGDLTRAII